MNDMLYGVAQDGRKFSYEKPQIPAKLFCVGEYSVADFLRVVWENGFIEVDEFLEIETFLGDLKPVGKRVRSADEIYSDTFDRIEEMAQQNKESIDTLKDVAKSLKDLVEKKDKESE